MLFSLFSSLKCIIVPKQSGIVFYLTFEMEYNTMIQKIE